MSRGRLHSQQCPENESLGPNWNLPEAKRIKRPQVAFWVHSCHLNALLVRGSIIIDASPALPLWLLRVTLLWAPRSLSGRIFSGRVEGMIIRGPSPTVYCYHSSEFLFHERVPCHSHLFRNLSYFVIFLTVNPRYEGSQMGTFSGFETKFPRPAASAFPGNLL